MNQNPKVAVLQFPGINSEYETRRALWDAQIDAEFFRWNDDPTKLDGYDGFVIAGGFSYEDRGRAGLIASMDPVMDALKQQAAKGKPILGICNGAQILVESGLVPGGPNNELLMCLARNKRVKDGKVLGVGFYNENVHVKASSAGRTAFTLDYAGGEIEKVPVAHGEGRFTTEIPGLMDALEASGQIVFKYSTADGSVLPDFPVNPNGALLNAAAICNPAGNVMAIMPHPERAPSAPMPRIFSSMRKFMTGTPVQNPGAPLAFSAAKSEPQTHAHAANTLELYVKLIITDNEAQTLENALRQRGHNISLNKWTHFEIEHASGIDQAELALKLIASGELLNTNKETATVVTDSHSNFQKKEAATYYLVRDLEDPLGASKTSKIKHHGIDVKIIRHGWFWEISGDASGLESIFANPHAQRLLKV